MYSLIHLPIPFKVALLALCNGVILPRFQCWNTERHELTLTKANQNTASVKHVPISWYLGALWVNDMMTSWHGWPFVRGILPPVTSGFPSQRATHVTKEPVMASFGVSLLLVAGDLGVMTPMWRHCNARSTRSGWNFIVKPRWQLPVFWMH